MQSIMYVCVVLVLSDSNGRGGMCEGMCESRVNKSKSIDVAVVGSAIFFLKSVYTKRARFPILDSPASFSSAPPRSLQVQITREPWCKLASAKVMAANIRCVVLPVNGVKDEIVTV
jgi:hypothetical protein